MHLLFGMPFVNGHATSGATGPMLASFDVLVPVLIGVFTAHAARRRPPGLMFALFGPRIPVASTSTS